MYLPLRKQAARLGLAIAAASLAGCNTVVLNPSGDVAKQQAALIWQSVWLMLIIIIPVMLLVLFFAYRYRASNTDTNYDPDWDHSTRLELLIWGAPLLIIIALGTITWISTHKLDPYRPLDRIDANRPITTPVKPLEVDVVAMDWKWLFIYPEEGIAVVNQMAAPVDRPINFRITASTVMNGFYVPALAGMVIAMPGMEIQLHAVMNKPGDFQGLSSNYSGAGFSDMRFRFLAKSDADFAAWVAQAKKSGDALTRDAYLKLDQPSQREPVRFFGSVEDGLFDLVSNRCVDGKQMCISQMMKMDAQGGQGRGSVGGLREGHALGDQKRTVVAALCTPANPSGLPETAPAVAPAILTKTAPKNSR